MKRSEDHSRVVFTVIFVVGASSLPATNSLVQAQQLLIPVNVLRCFD